MTYIQREPDTEVLDFIYNYFNQCAIDYSNEYKRTQYRVDAKTVKHNSRRKYLVLARKYAIYYLYVYCYWTMVDIGHFFNRDHTTITHSLHDLYGNINASWYNEDKEHLQHFSAILKIPERYRIRIKDKRKKNSIPRAIISEKYI